MSNPYLQMLPQPPADDKRKAVKALRQFAEALQQYAGINKDIEVSVGVHPEPGPDNVAEIQISVYVPKTDYLNIVLVARCKKTDGFPVTIDPYFAGNTFPKGLPPCKDETELNLQLERFVKSPEILSLLDYMKQYAQDK